MRQSIVGYGEIGKAVHKVVGEADVYDKEIKSYISRSDVLHICFPYSENFIHQVQEYMIQFNPAHTIIWSTVQIGTTKKIAPEVVHSPVEGKHPNLDESIRTMTRWVGYNNRREAKFFKEYFVSIGIKCKLVKNSNHTEALKLLSTTEYGINIAFAKYKAEVAEGIKMPFDLTKEWNKDYNNLYKKLGLGQFQKYQLDPPEGPIGGHCVLPNIEILEKLYPSDILEIIKEVE